jgi:hydrogenase maturation protease
MSDARLRLPDREARRSGRTLVLALGSSLRGDDGAAGAVMARLATGGPPPADVDLLDGGTPGLETALMLEGYRRAIIIDAADLGRRPGEWARLDVDRSGLVGGRSAPAGERIDPTSIHRAGLAEALELGATLGVLPESVTVYAIQPLECGWSTGLSRPVEAAVVEVSRAVEEEIGSS